MSRLLGERRPRGNTASDCNLTGTNGSTTQQGDVDAAVPVTVCDVIAEIGGTSTAKCPQEHDSVTQTGQLADVYAPATVCGVIAEVDGTSTGMCMPDARVPLVNGVPTNSVSQSAPVDGVAPVNACSVVAAVDGTASNSCEPSHVVSSSAGSVPVSRAGHVLLGGGGPRRDRRRHVHGQGHWLEQRPDRQFRRYQAPASRCPLTLCGIEAAFGGSADASCPGTNARACDVAVVRTGERAVNVGRSSGGSGVHFARRRARRRRRRCHPQARLGARLWRRRVRSSHSSSSSARAPSCWAGLRPRLNRRRALSLLETAGPG